MDILFNKTGSIEASSQDSRKIINVVHSRSELTRRFISSFYVIYKLKHICKCIRVSIAEVQARSPFYSVLSEQFLI